MLLSDFLQMNELEDQGKVDEGEISESERRLLGDGDVGLT